jgi:murein DD-endopeptidase MepM/ murein hydrolase activator NlpD
LILFRAKPAAGSTVPTALEGQFAGEPLHFDRDSTGTFTAYGGIPVEARGRLPLPLKIEGPDSATDSLTVHVPVASAQFRTEELTVDPKFTTPPDSALAARIERENEEFRQAWMESHQRPRMWKTPFARPRPSRITDVFGTGRMFNGVLKSRHLGTDFDGKMGETIRASNDGVVSLVGDFFYSGNTVVIDHGEGIATAYLHMSRVLVKQGDSVSKGQLIGLVGATGRVTGPHLHWIAKYGTISVNPMSLLSVTAVSSQPGIRRARRTTRSASKTTS